MPPKPVVQVLVNPVSGRTRRDNLSNEFCRLAEAAGFDVRVQSTQAPGDAGRVAANACEAGARALVVFGGDGTISEVVGGMTGEGVPILAAPTGTENILAKYLGIPLDAARLCEILLAGREARFDVVARNGRRFLIVAGVGFDAQVVQILAARRRGHIAYPTYFGPLWRTFWSYRHPELLVEADGEEIFRGCGLALVGNLPRYAIGLRVLQRALPDDGLLDVCVFRCKRQWTLLRHALNVALGRHIGRPGVVYRQAKRVRISSQETTPVQIDGDVSGCLPAEFRLCEANARFLVPQDGENPTVMYEG